MLSQSLGIRHGGLEATMINDKVALPAQMAFNCLHLIPWLVNKLIEILPPLIIEWHVCSLLFNLSIVQFCKDDLWCRLSLGHYFAPGRHYHWMAIDRVRGFRIICWGAGGHIDLIVDCTSSLQKLPVSRPSCGVESSCKPVVGYCLWKIDCLCELADSCGLTLDIQDWAIIVPMDTPDTGFGFQDPSRANTWCDTQHLTCWYEENKIGSASLSQARGVRSTWWCCALWSRSPLYLYYYIMICSCYQRL